MKTVVTVRVEFDHAEFAARFGVDAGEVPGEVRGFAEDVAGGFRDGGPEPSITYQEVNA